ncbi:MAG TPA: hypothetical protein VFV99_10230 [Kofleriaceae bacterium]|nr:hypothetical protein [Kofleriaceae bacterium]
MWPPAVVRFGALALVAMSCWSGKSPDSTLDNRALSGERDMTAAYYCSIQDGDFKYPAFPCAVRKIEGRWMLAKLAGSQRFRGEVTPRGEGFSFDGELYCPWGDCTQPLHGVFKSIGNGALRGVFRDASMTVVLKPAPDAAFGGATYGGDGYGGFGYGGATYGLPAKQRGNRRP